ncbi:MAG: DUF4159 domain-containing protein [Gemmatimonadetes bacterium]|jgi:hypothetical protein|nr:DUF4159 domain-containing protein [Gemmatimonadota bacterium]MBT4609940.1 DUF4159 domain-containing protein [Gemmatimonadota bacterium]MBT5060441.1 DUF4159 domain-containing protein [Gemmatimonadota bacterium]MBT5142413.1 DUF4159 domain-containing protein [Gemmatimonadota bacterium]MBT5588209.1 DUF4159 domain-containing protein [Gemmatimonadota bacterium]
MASAQDRFSSPSDRINFRRLILETRRLTIYGLLIASTLLSGGVLYSIYYAAERKPPPPALTRLVIRKPRSTKQFVLKRQRLRPRAMTKEVTALRPRLQRPAPRLQGLSGLGRVQSFDYALDTGTSLKLDTGPIELSATRIAGTKEPEKRIAMREELIDLRALDTGKFKGLIIQDPSDRRNVRGFVYLGTAWATDLEPTFDSAAKAVPNLVRALNEQTGITAKVDAHLFVDSQALFRTPFVFLTAQEAFELTAREIENLGEYMRRGGFVFTDNANPTAEFSQAEAALRQIFGDALRGDGVLQIIPNDHPIYHTYYDFDGPPVGSELEVQSTGQQRDNESISIARQSYHLEGVFVDGRLVAIYSDKGYVHTWARNYGNEPQLRFGINAVIFALTQEGSIAQQQIDFYSEGSG